VDQAVEAVGVELVADDPVADAPDGVPVDAQKPGDRCLVRLRGQERGHVLEVAGEPAAVPGERDRLHNDCMLRALQPAQTHPDFNPDRPKSRCRQLDHTGRVSCRKRVRNPQCGH